MLHRLGCRLVLPDYEIVYTEFGYPVIDNLAKDSELFVLNMLAQMLPSVKESPAHLCAELVHQKCENIYDVIVHLENRPKLTVLEGYTDIVDFGKVEFYARYYAGKYYNQMTYEEYIKQMYHENGGGVDDLYIKAAMERLRFTDFCFTEYGLVYQDPEDMLPF